ncbi:hypothetical protein FZEAL_8482 [Fusarium zealandicum]|uniref:CCHC-type domain-containing protein n=1 Tax=Fusarium zealandicum TaxID=1053134 RepID=A0A8H4UDS9_9HYPO|nr:hypothetical protein FZEAL_8482 [Fusarium zealandicum]
MAPETPRGVSSRLLTMKFMQRAVASANSSPDSETHSAKKRKTGHSPSGARIDLNIDEASIKAALNDQETKRQSALEQHVGAETHWVLNNAFTGPKAASGSKPPLNVVYVGYGDIDSSNESGDNEDAPAKGRTSTGNFKSSKNQARDNSDSGSDDSGASTPARKRKSSSDDPHSRATRSRSRSRSQSRQSMESAKAKELRERRKKKEVKLSKRPAIASGGISSGGGSQFSPANSKSMTCYKCHQAGHKAVDCPSSGGSRGRSNR